jgi:protein SCO1/2
VRLSAALLAAIIVAACASAELSGTDLGKREAPDFTLVDGPTGERVALSSLRGRVVALSFLYTNCPDVCPLTAGKFRTARQRLGDRASEVAFVAVSVDPARDTPEATRRFIAEHEMSGAMRYLIGDEASLRRIWSAYGIAAVAENGRVGHNDAIYLIDKQGRERTLLHSDVDVETLARDLAALASEGRLF